MKKKLIKTAITTDYAQFANPGFYTPVTTSDNSRFDNNGFTSFIGANMPFDIQVRLILIPCVFLYFCDFRA